MTTRTYTKIEVDALIAMVVEQAANDAAREALVARDEVVP